MQGGDSGQGFKHGHGLCRESAPQARPKTRLTPQPRLNPGKEWVPPPPEEAWESEREREIEEAQLDDD